jgi:DnaJ like chaperone protein
MSIWARLGDCVSRVSGNALSGLLEAVRTVFQGDPALRRKVAFSIAMIALSAKMAKADGIVSQDEVQAFQQIFSVPADEMTNVARVYNLAKGDTAGFDAYASRMAALFPGEVEGEVLGDILDGLFHIAKADGYVHEREVGFLRRAARIFRFDEPSFEAILARHVDQGGADPYRLLGVGRDASPEEIRKHYLQLVAKNHPDRLIARGVPEEFVALANDRMAALNVAYETIEHGLRRQ